ncbi:hypothetical protein PV04_06867 [Phialophora macrospora]|uniref:Uncharacterized protein n=1 Tax=Phialophora macrospora TaxID=1851006 RepID=A0A0D2FLN3_9EURO|nr:hypothetical protein PV04_06867 [Phialophora macrospora]
MAFESQPSVMPNHPGHSSIAQAHGRQRPHLAIPTGDQDHVDTSQVNSIFTKLEELLAHTCFQHYSSIIQDLFEADHQHWHILCFLRLQSPCALFQRHHTSIYYNPPPDLFDLVAQIREDKSWQTQGPKVLARLGSVRRLSGSSWPDSRGSGLSPYQATHLTPATRSVHSASRESQSLVPPGIQYGRVGSGYQCSSQGAGSSVAAGSPTPTEGYISVGNAGRTAPPGHCFYCPSRNCSRSYPRKGYTRQGHYENHMQTRHAEWPTHDPLTSLQEIPTHEYPSASNMHEHTVSMTSAGVRWPTTPQPQPQPRFAVSTPHTPLHSLFEPGSERPSTPNPDTVFTDTLQSGTVVGSSQGVWCPLDIQQNYFPQSSQPMSNSNQSFHPTDCYMQG